MAAGLGLRIWAAISLGRFYTRTLRTSAGQTVVSRGPYAVVRHPGYLSDLIMWLGFGLTSGTWIVTAGIGVPMAVAYARRIDAEEKMLHANLGSACGAYVRRTSRLLPRVTDLAPTNAMLLRRSGEVETLRPRAQRSGSLLRPSPEGRAQMEYGTLIRGAWSITWRYRFLWVLELLAGGGSVMLPTGGAGGGPSSGPSTANPSWSTAALDAAGVGLSAWASANMLLVAGLVGVAIGIIVAVIAASFVAKGGMAQATTELATGHSSSFGSAWRAGVRFFWRYVGLWLLLIGAALVSIAAIGLVFGLAVLAYKVTDSWMVGFALVMIVDAALVVTFVSFVLAVTRTNFRASWKIGLAATLFALPIFPVLVVVGLGLSIVVAFAQRAIAMEDVGPVDAFKYGWHLMRTHIAESLLTWLINAALALASGLAAVAAGLGGLLAVSAVGALLFAAVGLSTPLVTFVGAGALLLFVGALTVSGITNTFFWSYWTLVYLRLSGRANSMEVVA